MFLFIIMSVQYKGLTKHSSNRQTYYCYFYQIYLIFVSSTSSNAFHISGNGTYCDNVAQKPHKCVKYLQNLISEKKPWNDTALPYLKPFIIKYRQYVRLSW
jgi:hypothetical protein